MKGKFFISTAIDYPSSEPHIGHAYEKVCADVIARYKRQRGFEVHFSTGTDEHGLKMKRSAEEAGMSPKEFVDSMSERFRDMCDELSISYDDFIRTTEGRHERAVKSVIENLHRNGDIYKGFYEGPYCVDCETFYSEDELVDGNCPIHGRKVEYLEEECYFFRMGKYREEILDHIEKNPKFIRPEGRRKEVVRRLEGPLWDLCMSRKGLEWGVPLPFDKSHTAFVWVDALINYLATIGYPDEKFRDFWPPNVHLIGKDISWHHCVIWSSVILSLGLPLPKQIFIHGFVTHQGQKLSKSAGLVIDPFHLSEKYSSDALRYFLVRNISFGRDGDFSEESLRTRLNSELADVLGNFVHRVLTFIYDQFDGKVPEGEIDGELESEVVDVIQEAESLMDDLHIGRALNQIFSIARRGNEYFQSHEPWRTIEENPPEAKNCLLNCINLVDVLRTSLHPFLPDACEKLSGPMNRAKWSWENAKKFGVQSGHKVKRPEVLFEKVELEAKEEEGGLVSIEDFGQMDIRIGRIERAEPIEGSDKLLRLELDVGGEIKRSVAGVAEFYGPEDLEGRKVPVLVNLEPTKILGVESECMILAADADGEPVLLEPEKDVEPGTKIK